VPATVSIGEFARMSQLSVRTLRRYHRDGLLEPAAVDGLTGYRSYTTDQLPTAQVIRRLRDLDMPLPDVQAVLATSDVAARNEVIVAHLDRMEQQLSRTNEAVRSLRALLGAPATASEIEYRSVPATTAATITGVVDAQDIGEWFAAAVDELRAAVPGGGPLGGLYADDLFEDERGEATLFVPVGAATEATGRVRVTKLAPVELAIAVHRGPHTDIDRTYAALGAHVAERAIGVEGPLREIYVTFRHDTPDEASWRTEIGWPIFRTAS
jgi:DNA-binding transcriptional MerR regulator